MKQSRSTIRHRAAWHSIVRTALDVQPLLLCTCSATHRTYHAVDGKNIQLFCGLPQYSKGFIIHPNRRHMSIRIALTSSSSLSGHKIWESKFPSKPEHLPLKPPKTPSVASIAASTGVRWEEATPAVARNIATCSLGLKGNLVEINWSPFLPQRQIDLQDLPL